MRSRFALAALAAAALAVPAYADDAAPARKTPAQNGGGATCSYVEISATTSKVGVIDPELKPLEKKLKKPPFTAWNTFKKLSSGAPALTRNKPETLKLKQSTASVMLRDRTPKRVELSVTLDNAQGKRVLDVKPAVKVSEWLLLVVSNAKDDGNILGLTCK